MKQIIRICNLDCAACAEELREELTRIEGIEGANVDFVTQRIYLEYRDEAALLRARDCISHFEEVKIIEGEAPDGRERHLKEVLCIALSLIFFLPALTLSLFSSVNEWVSFSLYLLSFAAAGWSVVWTVIGNIPKVFQGGFHPARLLDENLLMTVAAAGAFALKESMEGAIVMILYEIGELLQSLAVGSSRNAIKRLTQLKASTAIRLSEHGEETVAPSALIAGDKILLRKGDKVPADCKLLSESASLDTRSMTGESYFSEKRAGETLLSGCVNAGDAVEAEVLRPECESAAAKVLALVENASASKAKPEKFITKFSRIYTPVVVLTALLLAVIPPLFQGYNFAKWVGISLNFLVISCPCALIISIPLTYFSGVGALARAGVLAKGAVYLDLLAGVRVAAFDKTGTLTEGRFSVAGVSGEARALSLAAALEKCSSHPLAEAFCSVEAERAEDVCELSGMGMTGMVRGKRVSVGNFRLMRQEGVLAEERTGESLTVYVAEEGRLVGTVEIQDGVREEAGEALTALRRAGIRQIVVLSGDTPVRALASLKGLPVDEIRAGLMPAQKSEEAEKLKKRGRLMYVGDGVNDAPVMAVSDISVAMGGLGSDIAIETSDFVLAGDRLSALPKAVRGAKKTKKIVLENIVLSISIKLALMVLSLFGLIPLWAAVLGDTGVMLLAVLNSLRMRAKLK